MKTVDTWVKETITILHNTTEELRENVATLQADGWSPNIRNIDSIKKELSTPEAVESFQEEHPEILIHFQKETSRFSRKPFVLMTQHERPVDIGK